MRAILALLGADRKPKRGNTTFISTKGVDRGGWDQLDNSDGDTSTRGIAVYTSIHAGRGRKPGANGTLGKSNRGNSMKGS
ncbi:hypothetical protein MGN70_000779 [Eutypa lata]|nr:hypothetical protein MGN70_000779 [Eutypa lata]